MKLFLLKHTFLICILLPVLAKSMNADSLENLLKTNQNPVKRIGIYNKLSIFYKDSDWQKSFAYGIKTMSLADSLHDERYKAMGHANIGIVYFYQGDLPKAMQNFQKSLNIGERYQDTLIISNSLWGLYYVFSEIEDFEKSIDLVKQRMQINIVQKNTTEIISDLNNKGYIYSKIKQTDSAFYNYNKGINLAIAVNNKEKLSTLYSNLGNLYADNMAKYDSALIYHFKALKMRQEIKERYSTAYSMILIGKSYYLSKDYRTSEKYLFKGLDMSKKYFSYFNIKMAYDNIFKMYQQKRDFKKAMYYNALYRHIDDSIHTVDKINLMRNLKLELDMEKLESELGIQALELKNKDLIIKYFVVGAAIITLFAIALYYNYVEKNKFNKLLIIKNKELIDSHEEIEAQKALLEEQNEEIQTQSNELKIANDEITLINANLETLVAQRTEKLKEQNSVILDYAFMNSHRLRAPIARIMGLLQLIDMEKDSVLRQEYYTYLKKSVNDLDNMTREITAKLIDDSERGKS